MSGENSVRDLFGDLTVMPSGRRGRPAHQRNQSAANRVMLGCALGYDDVTIAKGLGVSVPTLRKYYFSELKMREMHRTRLDLWKLEKLAEAADAGNVGAMREIEKIMGAADRARIAKSLEAEGVAPEKERIGKKEAARRAAEKAASEGWGGDLSPGYTQH